MSFSAEIMATSSAFLTDDAMSGLTPTPSQSVCVTGLVLGADLRLSPILRFYGELGTGQVDGRRDAAKANFQNDLSLQQLFLDARGYAGSTLVGAMLGRQEFFDGPRQLISVSDGPNLHRSWNGVRLSMSLTLSTPVACGRMWARGP